MHIVHPFLPHHCFQGFAGAVNQMPFLYPHFFTPPLPGMGFTAPAHDYPSATINLTEKPQKQGLQEDVTHQTKSNKKRRISRKKMKIVELDDAKDDVGLLKNVGHKKDHCVIQLISLRGEMQNTFRVLPKQGGPISFDIFLIFNFLFFLFHSCYRLIVSTWNQRCSCRMQSA